MSIQRLLLTCLMISAFLVQASPAVASPANAITPPDHCAFGYAFQAIDSPWNEIKLTGTKLALEGDDAILQRVIGFNFKFFENTYTDVYISTNGFLSFGQQNENPFPNNFPIPAEYPPNNVLAGFWDDLTVGGTYNGGSVYYLVSGTEPNRKATIEWYRVTRLGSTDWVSFQVILSENGDITFSYETLNGDLTQATVGIEDVDGVDGCQLVYNAAGLESNKSYKLAYPANGPRVKAKPLYQGGFLLNGLVDLPITLVNTGTDTDTFHFQAQVLEGENDWQIKVVDLQKNTLTNTPSIASKQAFKAYIRVTSPDTFAVGEYVKGKLTVISNKNASKTFSILFDSSIPAPFAAFYVDSSAGYIKYNMPQHQITQQIFPSFSGSSFAVARSGLDYFLSWEYIRRGAQDYENIQKNMMGPTVGTVSPVANLVDHAGDASSVFDANPMIAVAPNGTIGLVFVRSVLDENYNFTTNLFFARLDSFGNLLPPMINLTNNSSPYPDLLYNLPAIAATTDNKFVVVYESLTPLGGGTVAKDIDVTVVNAAGQITLAHKHVTNSQASGKEFYSPTITQKNNGEAFIAFMSHESGMTVSQVNYTTLHANGSVDAIIALNGYGQGPQTTTLANGTILLAWINDGSLSAGYTLFNAQGVKLNDPPLELASANGWKIKDISLTGEVNGNGVINWRDEWGYFLYYALVGPTGAQATPPMAFLRGSDPSNPNIISSSSGKGIASLDNVIYWHVDLPIIVR